MDTTNEQLNTTEKEELQRFLFRVVLPEVSESRRIAINRHLRMGTEIDAAFWLEGVECSTMQRVFEEYKEYQKQK